MRALNSGGARLQGGMGGEVALGTVEQEDFLDWIWKGRERGQRGRIEVVVQSFGV